MTMYTALHPKHAIYSVSIKERGREFARIELRILWILQFRDSNDIQKRTKKANYKCNSNIKQGQIRKSEQKKNKTENKNWKQILVCHKLGKSPEMTMANYLVFCDINRPPNPIKKTRHIIKGKDFVI